MSRALAAQAGLPTAEGSILIVGVLQFGIHEAMNIQE